MRNHTHHAYRRDLELSWNVNSVALIYAAKANSQGAMAPGRLHDASSQPCDVGPMQLRWTKIYTLPEKKTHGYPKRVGFGKGEFPSSMAILGINSLDFWSVIPTLKSLSTLTMFSRKSPTFHHPTDMNEPFFVAQITTVSYHDMFSGHQQHNNSPTGTENTFSSSSSVDTAAWKRKMSFFWQKVIKSSVRSPHGIL